jgi:NOL1/NOP2/fmu family ribosome biogenesis protein
MFERKSSWWLLREARQTVFASHLKVSQVGMKAFQRVGAYVKPATRMIQSFGHNASRARVDLNRQQVLRLLAGEPLPIDLDLDEGYVILSLHERWILGLGLFVDGRIHSQLPRKTLRQDMLQTPEPHPRDQQQGNLLGSLSLYLL